VEKQSHKFSIKVVNKTATVPHNSLSAFCFHAYSCTTAAPSCTSTNKNFIAYLTSRHNSIFVYKLRTD